VNQFVFLSYMAAVAAIAGRGLTAGKNNKIRFWGFIAYIVGSILWIAYSGFNAQWALLIQNVILIGFSVLGLWNNK
jgi:hypothetical protein